MGVEFLSQVEKIGAESGEGLTLTEIAQSHVPDIESKARLAGEEKSFWIAQE